MVTAFTILAFFAGKDDGLGGMRGRAGAAVAGRGIAAGGPQDKGSFDIFDYQGADPVYLAAVAGRARGDRSWTWRWPGTPNVDQTSASLPARLAQRSPLLARVADDGAYLRSIFGSLALAAPVGGVILGVLAVNSTGGRALPPATGLTIAIAMLGVMDATAGLLALVTFAGGVLVMGGFAALPPLTSTGELRTMLALAGLWFALPIIAGAARPLRRRPGASVKARYDRLADFVIGSLIGAWVAEKIIIALPALSGIKQSIELDARTVALFVLLALVARMLGETVAVRLYPTRLSKVEPHDLAGPGPAQQLVAATLRTAIFLFVGSVVAGLGWQLWVAGALFLVPQLLSVWAGRVPQSRTLARLLPAGLLEIVIMIFLLTAIARILLASHSTSLEADSFVLLAAPAGVIAALHRFGRREKRSLGWGPRIAGIGVLAVGVLQVLGLLWPLSPPEKRPQVAGARFGHAALLMGPPPQARPRTQRALPTERARSELAIRHPGAS